MFIPTVFNAVLVLLPVLFVMALGVWSAHAKQFDRDQVLGLSELVATFALPASFLSIVTTPRSRSTAGHFVITSLIALVWFSWRQQSSAPSCCITDWAWLALVLNVTLIPLMLTILIRSRRPASGRTRSPLALCQTNRHQQSREANRDSSGAWVTALVLLRRSCAERA